MAVQFATCEGAMVDNPLIEFLASYGPQPSSNNLYDEFVVNAAQKTGCAPLRIDQPIVNELEAMLKGEKPRSIVLTGTAGDGKTYTARKLLSRLAPDSPGWDNTDKVFSIDLPRDRTRKVHFIKDLSELNEGDKDRFFDGIATSLAGSARDFYVICVNDGHLLKFFRDRLDRGGEVLHRHVTERLRMDEDRSDDPFRLINMSRQTSGSLVEDIIEAVVSHPDWVRCSGCPAAQSSDSPCPILLNRNILAKTGPGSLRNRLAEVIRIAAADGQHLSIRQLILLTSNLLLGDQQANSQLLTCTKARNRARDRAYDKTNPYANAFGANLTARERQRYGAFSVLSSFGVGYETNNYFDYHLLQNSEHLPQDPTYGSLIFDASREAYNREPASQAAEFREKIIEQRRRLFFSLEAEALDGKGLGRTDPWNLSIYKFSASYLELVSKVRDSDGAPARIARSLVRGLNRMLTSEMTDSDGSVWLTEPSGVYLGREIPLMIAEAGRPSASSDAVLSFPRIASENRPPIMRFAPRDRSDLAEDLLLRPTLFECLMRVASGALPASFSRECRQEVTRFQLRAAAAVREASRNSQPTPQQIQMINGELQRKPIAILSGEEEW